MFEWLRCLFGNPTANLSPAVVEAPKANGTQAPSDIPKIVERHLGDLAIPSRRLVLADPRCAPQVVLPKIPTEKISISATLWQYPSGKTRLAALAIRTGKRPLKGLRRKIGKITIDSGKLVVADRTDYETHWTEVTQDHLGILSTAPESQAGLPQTPWDFLPIENGSATTLFACQTGLGCYKVFVEFDEDRPEGIWIGFVE